MNGLGKNQDTVFEALEKGNYIAPPGGNDRDAEEIPQLRRAMEWLAPGLVLGMMLSYVGDDLELAAFLGGVIGIFGCVRLYEENPWCKAALWAAAAQVLCRCLRLFAQTLIPMLLGTAVYSLCLYASMIAGAAVPVLLCLGLWDGDRKSGALMAVAAAATAALPVLWLLGVMLPARIAVAVLGAGALLWLLVRSRQENEV